jgi:hypothetical protein
VGSDVGPTWPCRPTWVQTWVRRGHVSRLWVQTWVPTRAKSPNVGIRRGPRRMPTSGDLAASDPASEPRRVVFSSGGFGRMVPVCIGVGWEWVLSPFWRTVAVRGVTGLCLFVCMAPSSPTIVSQGFVHVFPELMMTFRPVAPPMDPADEYTQMDQDPAPIQAAPTQGALTLPAAIGPVSHMTGVDASVPIDVSDGWVVRPGLFSQQVRVAGNTVSFPHPPCRVCIAPSFRCTRRTPPPPLLL